jgi:hypothetical protein
VSHPASQALLLEESLNSGQSFLLSLLRRQYGKKTYKHIGFNTIYYFIPSYCRELLADKGKKVKLSGI